MSSASGGFAPRPAPGLCPWTPLEDFCPQSRCFVPLRNKFLATPLIPTGARYGFAENLIWGHRTTGLMKVIVSTMLSAAI